MITPQELRNKADKQFFKMLIAHYQGISVFPWTIPSNKQIAGSNYSEWRGDLLPLHQQSKEVRKKGYSVEWKAKKINGSNQSVPARIFIESWDDFLYFTNRSLDFQKIDEARNTIVGAFPQLESWANQTPYVLLDNADVWKDLMKVCLFFVVEQQTDHYYIRELPVEVHSKFIEDNSKVLKILLDQLLPEERIRKQENNFAARYYLKKPGVYTQIRVLDESLKSILGYDECAITLEDTAWLTWVPEKVFIIENKTCFLTFPQVKNAVAIFGEGFKSRISKHIPWLEQTQLYCWFDLDAAGFEMLNMIRAHYPKALSLLMDRDTYKKFGNFSVENNYKVKQLPLLTQKERELYNYITLNKRRLEQERISQQYVSDRLLNDV
jgi:hypothetical protein